MRGRRPGDGIGRVEPQERRRRGEGEREERDEGSGVHTAPLGMRLASSKCIRSEEDAAPKSQPPHRIPPTSQSATTTGAASNSTTSSVNLDHAHTIAYGGDHSHGGNTGNGTDYQIVANNSAGTTAPHYDHKHTISSDGSHNHGGGTGWMDSHQDHSHTMAHTHDFTHTHTSDAGTFDLRAKSVGLVPCMKVLYY
jgi:hypothetical protein